MSTLQQVITAVDAIQPNPYTNAQKMAWLNEAMAMVQTDVWLINAYNVYQFSDYATDYNKDLPPVPPAYAMLWQSWLKAKIHAANEENDLYANAAAMFNEAYGAYVRWFARTYEPAQRGRVLRLRFDIAANGEQNKLCELPERSLAADIQLNVTVGDDPLLLVENKFQILACASQNAAVVDYFAIGPEVSARSSGNHSLGWINASEISGDMPCNVLADTTGNTAQAVLTMKVFVPEDVYIMMQHNRHHDPSWGPWND